MICSFKCQLDGSLLVIAENIMGSTQAIENGEPLMQYGHRYFIYGFLFLIKAAITKESNLVNGPSSNKDVQGVNCRMSRSRIKELTGLLLTMSTGCITFTDSRV